MSPATPLTMPPQHAALPPSVHRRIAETLDHLFRHLVRGPAGAPPGPAAGQPWPAPVSENSRQPLL